MGCSTGSTALPSTAEAPAAIQAAAAAAAAAAGRWCSAVQSAGYVEGTCSSAAAAAAAAAAGLLQRSMLRHVRVVLEQLFVPVLLS
jgi:hypothetical protein